MNTRKNGKGWSVEKIKSNRNMKLLMSCLFLFYLSPLLLCETFVFPSIRENSGYDNRLAEEKPIEILKKYVPNAYYFFTRKMFQNEGQGITSFTNFYRIGSGGKSNDFTYIQSVTIHEVYHMYSLVHNRYYIDEDTSFTFENFDSYPAKAIDGEIPPEIKETDLSLYSLYIDAKPPLATQTKGYRGLLNECAAYFMSKEVAAKLIACYDSDDHYDPHALMNAITNYYQQKVCFLDFRYYLRLYTEYAKRKDETLYAKINDDRINALLGEMDKRSLTFNALALASIKNIVVKLKQRNISLTEDEDEWIIEYSGACESASKYSSYLASLEAASNRIYDR
jgi:hypothetical protein